MAFKMDINWTEWFIMTKKIAVINDLSGFGKCSLTAAISVIASMGVQPCPLPTAILSAQTGFPSYFYDDYTDRMDAISAEWKKMNVRFDGIYTGFLSGRTQIGKVMSFLDTFYKDDTFLLVDPVMGDNGERFSIFSSEFQQEMKELAARADIATPNLTELCLLTGEDSRLAADIANEKEALETAKQMAGELMAGGTGEVVVTGMRVTDSKTGEEKMGNLAVTREAAVFSTFPLVGGSYSGTGDLFASVVAGGRARGDALEDSVKLAGEMIGKAIADSVRGNVPRDEGVDYEKYLWMLKNPSF